MADGIAHIEHLIQCGVIRVGMTRLELFSVLGSADEEGGVSRKHSLPSIYKYGDVQFVFPPCRYHSQYETQGLTFVYIDDGDQEEEPRVLLQ